MRVVMIEISWQVSEEVSRDMTGEADGMNQEVDSRDVVMHIWMSNLWFLVRRWLVDEKGWQRRAGIARGLNRDQIFKIARLTGCKNFVGKRKNFILNAFVDFKAVERSENRSDMWGFMSLNNSTSKSVLNLLEPVKLIVWKAVIEKVLPSSVTLKDL